MNLFLRSNRRFGSVRFLRQGLLPIGCERLVSLLLLYVRLDVGFSLRGLRNECRMSNRPKDSGTEAKSREFLGAFRSRKESRKGAAATINIFLLKP